jgi:N-methylhydantoinase A
MRFIVGSDIGGTFTEAVAYSIEGKKYNFSKVPSTPPTFVDGLLTALKKLPVKGDQVDVFLAHGSTIATNALLERRGAEVILITTRGFRDVILAARADREVMYDLSWDPPPPLVRRRNILEVDERIDYEGKIMTPLDEHAVVRCASIANKRGIKSIAICFINSYINPVHEIKAKEIIKRHYPEMYVTTSSELVREIREFERFSTAVANAYVAPIILNYLTELDRRLKEEWGFYGDILITHTGGGVITTDEAIKVPIWTCHSSPVSGAIGLGQPTARLIGVDNFITFEMGGTSCEMCLFLNGKPTLTYEWRVQFNTPIMLPTVDALYLGAGGGSIAWVDEGGSLRVGPRSAGADPGPACYGKGGEEPTLTDAQLILGRINPKYFLGGEMPLYLEKAKEAIIQKICNKTGMDLEEAAVGILRIALSETAHGVRKILIRRGLDPRDFVLITYGGSGPLYAAEIAQELGIPRVVVPPHPAFGSALGTLFVDFIYDNVSPVHKIIDETNDKEIKQIYDELLQATLSKITRQDHKNVNISKSADLKYYDQSRYLTIPVEENTTNLPQILKSRFLQLHERVYGYVLPEGYADIEIVNLRVRLTLERKKPIPLELSDVGIGRGIIPKEERKVYFTSSKDFLKVPIYERELLGKDTRLKGPCIIEEPTSTTLVPPGSEYTIDKWGNIIINIA